MNKSYRCLFLFMLLSQMAYAQKVGVLRNNPTSLKWYDITTPHFDIIFPKYSKDDGYKLANTMELLYGPVSKTMRAKPIHTPLILQDQSTVSNAFVTINPYRMEFFSMPPQDYNFLGTYNWLNLLSVHEFRHAAQQSYSYTGKTKWIKILFGEQTAGGIAHLVYPDWFWEGDAVATETALSSSGRGRIPHFNIALKANLLEKPMFNYYKQVARSFNDFVPNHYVMGYNMVTYLRKKQGAYIWSDIQQRSLNKFYLPFSWSLATKKYSGMYTKDVYKATMNDLKVKWQKQVDELTIQEGSQLSTTIKKSYTDYLYPQFTDNGEIISLKSGFDNISQFVSIDQNGSEKHVFTPGEVVKSGMLSVVKNKIVWAEQNYDPRWRMRTYSNIKIYDINTNKLKKLTHKGRYGSPAFSPDGTRIIASEVNSSSESYLVVLDANTGDVLKRWKTEKEYLFSMPRWSNNTWILAFKHKQGEKALIKINSETGEEKILLPYSDENIGHAVQYKDYILYNSPYTGIDNIYATHLPTQKKYRVTSAKYGAYNAIIDEGKSEIVFNKYNVNGMSISRLSFDPENWEPIESVKKVGLDYFKTLEEQENNADILSKVDLDSSKYKLQKYKAWKHLIKPYSWGLAFSSTENQLLVGVASANYLSTMALDAGYAFDYPSMSGRWFVGASYQGWYPIIDFKYTSATRQVKTYDPFGRQVTLRWYEDELNAGLRLPLLLTNSRYNIGLNLGSEFNYVFNRKFDDPLIASFKNAQKKSTFYKHDVFLYSLLKRNERDLYSKWGASLGLYYRYTFDKAELASMFASNLQLYLPGVANHHSTQLRGTYSHAPNSEYLYRTPYHYPRGYSARLFKNLYTTTIAYAAPIWYPDLSVDPLVNFKRLSLEGFVDYGYGENYFNNSTQVMRSFGLTLGLDGNLFRFKEMLGLKFTGIYVPETKEVSFQFGINASSIFQN